MEKECPHCLSQWQCTEAHEDHLRFHFDMNKTARVEARASLANSVTSIAKMKCILV